MGDFGIVYPETDRTRDGRDHVADHVGVAAVDTGRNSVGVRRLLDADDRPLDNVLAADHLAGPLDALVALLGTLVEPARFFR